MTATEWLDVLNQTQLFQGLPPDQLVAIAQVARPRSYRKGEFLFHQGDEGSGFFVVAEGRVKVFQMSPAGREQILHVFSAGDHFAEVPALDGDCFPASAAALDPVQALFFPRQFFLDLLQQNPQLAINMLKGLSRHLRRFSHLVDTLSLKEVPARLATYLIQLSDRIQAEHSKSTPPTCIELDLNKSQLAALLGTIPETLSRVFYKLSQDGLIEIDGAKITICDRQKLENLTGNTL